MRVVIRSAVASAAVVLFLGQAVSAQAQVLGVYRWALLPYCNVLTLLVEQKGAGFQLSGTDDQCGAQVAAAASGTAHFNPNGTVSIALTVVRPDGISISGTASISVATFSGTWADQYGNSGNFHFNPAGASGSPRPVTLRGSYGIIFHAAAASQDDTASFSFTLPLAAPPLAPAANIIAVGGAPTLNCPGTLANPLAAPGHLCIYESLRSNVSFFVVFNSAASANVADRTGASVIARSTAAGQVAALGKWAMTAP
jgi:hypothetical protein